MQILMVLTSHDKLGKTGRKTGVWLEEFAAPYYVFKDAGAEITIASATGGQPPIDPASKHAAAQTDNTRRFDADTAVQAALAHTRPVGDLRVTDFDGVFYPGGHGPLWDLAESAASRRMIETMYAAGKPVAAVCHAPAVFRHTQSPDGTPLVQGKRVTGFSDSEEAAAGFTKAVPFLVEELLKQNGAAYSKVGDGQPYVVTDGNLITGQNAASAAPAAQAMLQLLQKQPAPRALAEQGA